MGRGNDVTTYARSQTHSCATHCALAVTVENGVEWADGGISVCSAVGAQDQPRLTTGPNGGAYYVTHIDMAASW